VRLTIGYGNDQQSVGVYGYDFAAQMLENCVVNTVRLIILKFLENSQG